MKKFRMIPILGLKTDVPPDDPSLIRFASEGIAYTYDTGGQNISYARQRGAATKSYGYSKWSTTAISSASRTHALFELDDGTNRDNLSFDTGRVFYWSSGAATQIQNHYLDYTDLSGGSFAVGDTITGGTASTESTVVHVVESGTTGTLYIKDITGGDGGYDDDEVLSNGTVTAAADGVVQHTTFSNTAGDLYSVIRFGSYLVFADGSSGHTPQKWKNGDNDLTNLITKSGATLYKFRYLVEWQRRIIGAYSNQTNGDLEIRWTGALPTWTDLEFAAANQLYKPGTDSISGISKLGTYAVLVYGTDSINRLDYYASASTPFGFTTLVQGEGTPSHWSIVNYQGANWFFNKNLGFVRYIGGSKITKEDIISTDIEDIIADIDPTYYDLIVGCPVPLEQKILWLVPLDGATSPSHILSYNIRTGAWEREDKAFHFVDVWTRESDEPRKPVLAKTDGHVYSVKNENADGSAIDGYRIEPILDFGDAQMKKLVTEVWFSSIAGAAQTIDVYHRGGDTVNEVLAAPWTSMGTLPCPLYKGSEYCIYMSENHRLHQFKWGTDLANQPFTINWIDIYYEPTSRH